MTAHQYSIDELARAAGMTVRNVRAYQDRGVLPPPERRGRAGIYSDVHLARLRLIGQLLERGYTLANISEILEAWERGHDLSEFLGLEVAIATPWSEEVAGYFTLSELMKLFGKAFTPEAIRRATELGVLVPDGARFRAPSPPIVHAGAELVSVGVPMEALLDVLAATRSNVERVADELVGLVDHHVFEARYGKDGLPPGEDAPELAALVWRLRPLAKAAIHSEVARALQRSVERLLGDRLSHLLDHPAKASANSDSKA